MDKQFDCAIIGSGPAGCSAAVYLGMSGIKSILFTGPTPGGLLTKTHQVDNYLGMYGSSGMEITEKFMDHARKFAHFQEDSVENIVDKQDYLEIYYGHENKSIKVKYAIVACGSSPKKLGVPGESALGVSYCAICDGFFYRNKVVCVVGGGNSAFEEALYMSNICEKVYLIHRSDHFKAFQTNIDKVKKAANIDIITNSTVKEFVTDNKNQLTGVTISSESQERTLDVWGAFIAIGYGTFINFVNHIDKKDGYIHVSNNFQSSDKKIFACGDCIYNDSIVRYKQASISAAEGCVCALEISKKF